MITFDLGKIITYVILLGVGLLGSNYKKEKKKEQFGDLIGRGQLVKKRIPLNRTKDMIYGIVISSGYVWESIAHHDTLLAIGFTITAIINSLVILYDIHKHRNMVLIFEKGIEVNNDEIPYNKMDSIKRNENNKYTVKRKWHRDIVYEITEEVEKEETATESREEIYKKAFPEIFDDSKKI